MKKFLSILAAVGLTATASSSVVACGAKKSKTTNNNVNDKGFQADKNKNSFDDAFATGKDGNITVRANANKSITGQISYLAGSDEEENMNAISMVATFTKKLTESQFNNIKDSSDDNSGDDSFNGSSTNNGGKNDGYLNLGSMFDVTAPNSTKFKFNDDNDHGGNASMFDDDGDDDLNTYSIMPLFDTSADATYDSTTNYEFAVQVIASTLGNLETNANLKLIDKTNSGAELGSLIYPGIVGATGEFKSAGDNSYTQSTAGMLDNSDVARNIFIMETSQTGIFTKSDINVTEALIKDNELSFTTDAPLSTNDNDQLADGNDTQTWVFMMINGQLMLIGNSNG